MGMGMRGWEVELRVVPKHTHTHTHTHTAALSQSQGQSQSPDEGEGEAEGEGEGTTGVPAPVPRLEGTIRQPIRNGKATFRRIFGASRARKDGPHA